MYFQTHVDNHIGSNLAKAALVPFVTKPKATVELWGARANVRLHLTTPAIFVRCPQTDNEDAALDQSSDETRSELVLVKLEVLGDKRQLNKVVFTQLTGKATRSETLIEINKDQVANSEWQKITPKAPLALGEYGLVSMPKGKNLLPTRVFEFAIDPEAPQNKSVVLPQN